MSSTNPYALYPPVAGKDMPPKAKHADHDQQFTLASFEAHALIHTFFLDWKVWQAKWMHLGASDTASAEAFFCEVKKQFRIVDNEKTSADFLKAALENCNKPPGPEGKLNQ